jgi:hypothetical protein
VHDIGLGQARHSRLVCFLLSFYGTSPVFTFDNDEIVVELKFESVIASRLLSIAVSIAVHDVKDTKGKRRIN